MVSVRCNGAAGRALCALLLAVCAGGCAGAEVNERAADQLEPPVTEAMRGLLSASLQTLLAPGEEYRLGPGDLIEVAIYDLSQPEPTRVEAELDAKGRVDLPLLGAVEASDRTRAELAAEVEVALARDYLNDPRVVVQIEEHRSQRIAVMGAVAEPGIKVVRTNQVTLAQALALAGGLSEEAGFRATVQRGVEWGGEDYDGPRVLEVDLEALSRGDGSQDVVVRPGDLVTVEVAARFFVTGYVEKPGEFRLDRRRTVLDAVALAGGLLSPEASPSLTRIRRRGARGEVHFLEIDLEAVLEGESEDLELQPGDKLEIRQGVVRGIALGFYNAVRGIVSFGYNLASLF